VKQIRITLSPGPKTIVAEDMEAFGEDCVLSFHLENIYRTAKSTTQNTIDVNDRWRQHECGYVLKAFLSKTEIDCRKLCCGSEFTASGTGSNISSNPDPDSGF
jgi:hypothetical protein